MLHTGDAASITLPGTGYFQVGNNEIYELFQSGWSGAPAVRELSDKGAAYPVRLDGRRVRRPAAGRKPQEKESKTSQMEAVGLQISLAARDQNFHGGRALWMEPLPSLLDLADLLEKDSQKPYAGDSRSGSREIRGVLGLFDDPANQCQPLFCVDLLQSGHILICGISMSGKSSLIQTFLYSLCARRTPSDLHIYGIDWGGGALRAFDGMPHVGLMTCEGEEEKARRILEDLDRRLADRKHILQGETYLRSGAERSLPLLLMVIDNYPGFREESSGKYDPVIQRLAKEGERMGIILLVSGTGISSSEIPFSLASYFKTRICLEQKETYDYTQVLGSLHLSDFPAGGRPGRGMGWCRDKILEFQTALCISDPDDSRRIQWIKAAGEDMSRLFGERALPVKTIPERVTEKMIADSFEKTPSDQPCFMAGYRDEDAKACRVPLPRIYCFPVVVDEEEYRKSLSCLLLWSARRRTDVDLVVIDQTGSFPADRSGITYLSGTEEIIEFFHGMIPMIRSRAGKEAEAGEGLDGMQDDGRHLLIYITHMKSFLAMAADESSNMTGFLNNIWSKGSGLGITFAALMDTRELAEMKYMETFEIFCRQGAGMLLGGSLAAAGIFDSSDLPLGSHTERLKKGRGYLFSEKGKALMIHLPPAKEHAYDQS